MRRSDKFLVWYFVFFTVLAAIAVIPGGTIMVLIATGMFLPFFGLPGFLVALSPTILIYSFFTLSVWFALSLGRRGLWLVIPALISPALVAFTPGYLSRQEAVSFATRMSQNDFVRGPAGKPKTIELIGDSNSGMFVYAQPIGDKNASCNDLCRRLLFNGEAAWVRMTHIPSPYIGKRKGPTWHATYRIEHRDSCPEVAPAGTRSKTPCATGWSPATA